VLPHPPGPTQSPSVLQQLHYLPVDNVAPTLAYRDVADNGNNLCQSELPLELDQTKNANTQE
jgi:hypothetical protein